MASCFFKCFAKIIFVVCMFSLMLGNSFARPINSAVWQKHAGEKDHATFLKDQPKKRPLGAGPPIKYRWGAGIAGFISPTLYRDTRSNYLAFPYLSYRGKRFTFYGPLMTYRIIGQRYLGIKLATFLYPGRFNPKDARDPNMRALNARHYSVMAGLQGIAMFNRHAGIEIDADRSFFAVDGGYYFSASAMATVPFTKGSYSLRVNPGIGIQYSTKKLLNYYYGISAQEYSKSKLAEYQFKSGAYSPFVSLSLIASYKKRWSVVLIFRANKLADSVKNSPMVGGRYAVTTVGFLSYAF